MLRPVRVSRDAQALDEIERNLNLMDPLLRFIAVGRPRTLRRPHCGPRAGPDRDEGEDARRAGGSDGRSRGRRVVT